MPFVGSLSHGSEHREIFHLQLVNLGIMHSAFMESYLLVSNADVPDHTKLISWSVKEKLVIYFFPIFIQEAHFFPLLWSLSSCYGTYMRKGKKEKLKLLKGAGHLSYIYHKGRKKTTDAESGTTVAFIALAAVEDKMAKKKHEEVGLNFYCFQRREAQRNGMMKSYMESLLSFFFLENYFFHIY
ncbi:hypothetical protein I3760_04G005200 [Carya illinoinensis]|nr:hypothetical protein I3760_04G005200 [Carya illinoinensis]